VTEVVVTKGVEGFNATSPIVLTEATVWALTVLTLAFKTSMNFFKVWACAEKAKVIKKKKQKTSLIISNSRYPKTRVSYDQLRVA
jgi:hypothetical protein